MHTDVSGQGHGLVLVHGFGGNTCSWKDFMPSLAQTRRVVALDLLGHGQSPKPEDGEYTIENQARLVLNTCDELLLNRFVLAGHSYGGAVSLELALQMFHGEHLHADALGIPSEQKRLEGLIVISGAAYPQKMPWHLKGMRSPFAVKLNQLLPPEAQMRLVLLNLFQNPLLVTREIVRDYAAPMSSPGYHKALHETVKNLVPENFADIGERYRQLQIPTLLIWGENDRIVPVEIGRRLEKDLPNSDLHVLPDCGHMPMHEKPLDVLNIIIKWLKMLERS